MEFVFAAYAITVVGLGVYLLWLDQRQRNLASDLETLEAELISYRSKATNDRAPM